MKYTTNYNLKKPDLTDTVNIGDLNANADSVDALLASMANTVSKNANGWFKDQKTGLIIQWGVLGVSFSNSYKTNGACNFPIVFPNDIFQVLVSTGPDSNLNYSDIVTAVGYPDRAQFTAYANTRDGTVWTGNLNIIWIAIGY